MVPGLRVASVTVAKGRFELRVHRLVGAPHGTRVEQTGWAIGPDEPLLSALLPLHGWREQDEVRAPQGTAYTPWAWMPRLSAEVEGTALYAALSTLTAQTGSTALADAVTEVVGGADSIEVRWADDGSVTRVTFEPLAVTHGT